MHGCRWDHAGYGPAATENGGDRVKNNQGDAVRRRGAMVSAATTCENSQDEVNSTRDGVDFRLG